MVAQTAHVCKLCEKPVTPGEAINGATLDHWDCSEALSRAVEADIARFAERAAPTVFELARANGGYRIHIVDNRTDVALCGHTPKNRRGRMMFRARWNWVERVRIGFKCCPKCEVARSEKGLVVEGLASAMGANGGGA